MSSVRMAPRRLAHFNLYVSDLPRSTAFYHHVCGIHRVAGEPDVPIEFLTNGSSHHELGLIEIREGNRIGRDGFVQGTTRTGQLPGLNHLGWEMPNEAELVSAYRRMDGHDLKYHTADHTIAHSVYVADVDGNMHEFFADTPYDWPKRLRGDVARLTGPWNPLAAQPSQVAHHERGLVLAAVEDAAVRPYKISHATLRTGNFAAMRKWMTQVAGLEERAASEEDGTALYRGMSSEMPFDLVLREEDRGNPLVRMGFVLPNVGEVDRALARLESAGITPLRAIGGGTSRQGFVLADPDGLEVEFFAFTGPVEAADLLALVS